MLAKQFDAYSYSDTTTFNVNQIRMNIAQRKRNLREPLITRFALTIIWFLFPIFEGHSAPDGSLPNVIYCLTDDQGWGDVSYNGHPVIKTPHLDAMASEGLRCDRFYAAASVCSPTRATLVTGRNNWRVNISSPTAFGEASLPKEEITLAQYLKPKGYTSAHFGKWHIGEFDKTLAKHHYYPPWEAGFDVTFSTRNVIATRDPYKRADRNKDLAERKRINQQLYFDNGVMIPLEVALKDPSLQGDDCRILMDRTEAFIRKMAKEGTPFYIYLCFHAVHTPLVTIPEYHQKYYRDLSDKEANYYSNISAIDAQMGRLRALLRELKIADNTMLWFSSDNGPNLKGKKSPESGDAQNGRFTYTKIGSTGAYKGWKRYGWEGGIRVCGLIEWPAVLKPGLHRNYPIVTTDFVPTVLAAVGITPSPDKPLDGENLLPYFKGERLRRKKAIGFHANGWDAWMTQQYKIVKGGKPGQGTEGQWELYDLEKDPFEDTNLAAQSPEVMQRLLHEWEAWSAGARADCETAQKKYPPIKGLKHITKGHK